MFLLSENVSIQLEALNLKGKLIGETPAMLQYIDSETAVIRLEANASGSYLRWGAPVRFHVEHETVRYDVTGYVNELSRESLATEPDGGDIRIKIWDCEPSNQRRESPRRKGKFTVLFRPAFNPPQGEWQVGWCLDLSAGGIRFRIPRIENLSEKLELEFTPTFGSAESSQIPFRLKGKTLRADAYGRRSDQLEVALKFEGLTIEQGMSLSGFLK